MVFDLNYTTPRDPRELAMSVESEVADVVTTLDSAGRNLFRKVLQQGRGNGRLAALNERQDASGLARHYETGLRDFVTSQSKDLSQQQKDILDKIAVLSFRAGYEEPNSETQPEYFSPILNLLN